MRRSDRTVAEYIVFFIVMVFVGALVGVLTSGCNEATAVEVQEVREWRTHIRGVMDVDDRLFMTRPVVTVDVNVVAVDSADAVDRARLAFPWTTVYESYAVVVR